ncbi:AbiTii domain-containing protein [Methanobacterium congolense]|uniref:AbiTii domain-containing protein n=1 Tax=Methanobacterium congolense TaxID=118062 RepID=A0A1D3L3S6_9EURY|nr:hypothetical protein [Methanobacterium congolense]SCG86237.1 putative protein [Methanobacterium congolense]
MNSIVLELQKEAIDSDIDISNLLRKTFLIAKKLEINELEHWVNLELNGYGEKDDKPDYRTIHGTLKFLNPYTATGYAEYNIEDEKIHELASTRHLSNSIIELEDLYKKSSTTINIEIDPRARQVFKKFFREDIVPDVLSVSVSQIKRLIDSVRNKVLEWSIKLQDDGILGENLNFTPEEKKIANEHNITYNTIIYGSEVQLGTGNIQNISKSDLGEIIELLTTIKRDLHDLELDFNNENELNVGIKTIESQLESKNPNKSIINEALDSIRTILEGCASSAIAPSLIFGISKLIGL